MSSRTISGSYSTPDSMSQPFSAVSFQASLIIQARPSSASISASVAPSKTGVIALKPNSRAAHPSSASKTWPRFIRPGMPSGFKIMSTGVPSSMKGISSTGSTIETQPLLPCRPAILSPAVILRRCATDTRTILSTPAERSALSSRLNTLTSTTIPRSPCGIRSEVSFTSRDFSPNMARSRRSSGVSSFSPLGVILPTRMSPGPTSAPMRMMPVSSKSRMVSSPTLGISRVISSGPNLVSRASSSYFSM